MDQDNGRESKINLYKQYKFVIAFENACATDYVTEKFFDPLIAGAVPIYLGAPNINEFAPGEHCFIHANDFKSPKELADYIEECYNVISTCKPCVYQGLRHNIQMIQCCALLRKT